MEGECLCNGRRDVGASCSLVDRGVFVGKLCAGMGFLREDNVVVMGSA